MNSEVEALPVVRTVVRVSLPDISQQAGEFNLTGKVGMNALIWQRKGCDFYRYVCMQGFEAGMEEEDCTTPWFKSRYVPDYVMDWMNRFGRILAGGARVFARK